MKKKNVAKPDGTIFNNKITIKKNLRIKGILFCFLAFIIIASSCVSKRKLVDAQLQYRTLQSDSALMASKICRSAGIQSINYKADINALNQQNTQLSNAASDTVNSLQQNLQAQQKRLQDLQNLLDQQRKKTEKELKNKMIKAIGWI